MREKMFATVPHGKPIPPKVWARVTDVAANHSAAGEEWVLAGKPRQGEIFEKLRESEEEYNQAADSIWFAAWTQEQREEWDRINLYRD